MASILIADDHELIRDTLGAYLSGLQDFSISTVDSLEGAIIKLKSSTIFDLAIVDYRMPGMNGLDGFALAMRRFPATKFVLMSGMASSDVALKAMELGARGYFPKSLSAETMIGAIRLVLSGDRYYPFQLIEETPTDEAGSNFRNLSERETQTLRHLCQGKSNKEIARELNVQEVTIKLHVKNMLAKLNAKNRTHAALIAREDGFS